MSAGASGDAATGAPVVSESLVVAHAHGIHARPAALIARIAKNLPYEIEIRARGRGARARSTVALMSLGIRGGDEVVIAGFEASGRDRHRGHCRGDPQSRSGGGARARARAGRGRRLRPDRTCAA